MSSGATSGPALLGAVAEVRQLAGWVAFDTGRHADAQRHWLASERARLAVGNLQLAARVRYCQARQFQHLRHNRDALDTLRLARSHAGALATPGIGAMLHGAEAASLAALGRHDEARRSLADAEAAFERMVRDEEPEWMAFLDRGEVLAQHGRVYRDMARCDTRHAASAVRLVSEAIAAFGPQNVLSTVLNQVGLCSALFLAGEPEQAVAVGRQALSAAGTVSSARVADRIRNLTRDLAPYADMPVVRSLARAAAGVRSRRRPRARAAGRLKSARSARSARKKIVARAGAPGSLAARRPVIPLPPRGLLAGSRNPERRHDPRRGVGLIDSDVTDFIAASVPSVWALELLLFLRERTERDWPQDALVQELRSSRTVVHAALVAFEAAGLVRCEEGACAYQPASPALAELCDRLAGLYRQRPVAVINAITRPKTSSLEQFADAFRLKGPTE